MVCICISANHGDCDVRISVVVGNQIANQLIWKMMMMDRIPGVVGQRSIPDQYILVVMLILRWLVFQEGESYSKRKTVFAL